VAILVGRCAIVTDAEDGWICGTGSLRARLSPEKAVPEFVIHLLSSSQSVEWLQLNAVGQTMLNLNTSILSALPLILPGIGEQREIAAILQTHDHAIRALQAERERLRVVKRGLMQGLLSGQVRV
jgi:type I restriction enzyme S subunit